ncbi:MAG: EamA family transporter [Acidimicrobiia bacterium]
MTDRTVGPGAIPRTRGWGIGLAFATAAVSGFAVFLNSYGVTRFAGTSPSTYTTMKNLVAAVLLIALVGTATRRRSASGWTPPSGRGEIAGLAFVGIIGGGAAFVLFFEGLASASSTDAAFIHKTLVLWVVLLAVPLLHERLGLAHVGAVALLLFGQAALTSDLGSLTLQRGEWMIAAATVLWAGEVVVAKALLRRLSPLTVGAARLSIGTVALFAWLTLTGDLGQVLDAGAAQWLWALLTGLVLTAYVATWLGALARAQAIDVTAVLVLGAVITAALNGVFEGAALPDPVGLVAITAGAAMAGALGLRSRSRAGLGEVESHEVPA